MHVLQDFLIFKIRLEIFREDNYHRIHLPILVNSKIYLTAKEVFGGLLLSRVFGVSISDFFLSKNIIYKYI